MSQVQDMLKANKAAAEGINADQLVACINECINCAQVCNMCADACLAEQNVSMLVRCIRVNLDCADICSATARILSRQTAWSADIWHHQLHATVTACDACAQECRKHAQMHEHCRTCAEACQGCIEACNSVISSLHL
jgi:hypothetical protein